MHLLPENRLLFLSGGKVYRVKGQPCVWPRTQLIGPRVDPPELAQSDSLSWKLEAEHGLPVTSKRLWEPLAVTISCSEHRKSQTSDTERGKTESNAQREPEITDRERGMSC